MRPLPFAFAALLVSALAMPALASEVPSSDLQRFGSVVTKKKPVSLARLQGAPARFAGKTLRIEGVVKDVCQGQGCWVEVEDDRGATFLAKSLDESVLLPKDCKGRRIVVQGVVKALPAKGHEHEAAGEPHECPSPSFVLATQGVELTARK